MSERAIQYTPLQDLVPALANPKRHNGPTLAASVDRFGFVEPIVVDERTGRLVAGHGRLEELQRRAAAGEDLPDGLQANADGGWMVPVVRGWASANDLEADAYLIASNRTTELGGWDGQELANMLAGLADADALAGVGYDPNEVALMLAQYQVPDFQPTSVHDQSRLDEVAPIICPNCGHSFSRA